MPILDRSYGKETSVTESSPQMDWQIFSESAFSRPLLAPGKPRIYPDTIDKERPQPGRSPI